ncbi:MAG TPA: DUF4389 domain-containing protein [Gaiellaceae bacterium]|nr:DUF4389 domain-containing protein [Gaiellaceae bacterium]
MDELHPVRLVVEDDLRRSRLTVFFRLLLAIPHLIWFSLWSLAALIVAIVNWFATLLLGKPPRPIHRFLCAFVRYTVHLTAYLLLVGNPYPGFTGEAGKYPIDVELPEEPQAQSRVKTFFRLLLAVPAFLVGGALGGSIGFSFQYALKSGHGGGRSGFSGPGISGGGILAGVCAFLGWFASLATGRMPSGLRDAGAYGVGYGAQVRAYALLLTDRYPNSDPTAILDSVPLPPAHPVRVVGEAHDLRRSRVTVFFRFALVIPHSIWLELWGYLAAVVSVVNWFATLIMGRPPRWCHGFLSRYVRYQFHVAAFLSLAANPFPGFTGKEGTYPLDLELPLDPQRQSRWKTLFRLFLAIPAFFVSIALWVALFIASVCTWFSSLVTGSAPWGLRNLMVYALRYVAQSNAYLYLLTAAYPHASPLQGEDEEPEYQEAGFSAA